MFAHYEVVLLYSKLTYDKKNQVTIRQTAQGKATTLLAVGAVFGALVYLLMADLRYQPLGIFSILTHSTAGYIVLKILVIAGILVFIGVGFSYTKRALGGIPYFYADEKGVFVNIVNCV